MPRPTLPIKRPVKLKKAAVKKDKDTGAIIRDSSNRRKPLEVDSCQSVSVPVHKDNGTEPQSEN